ncbi:ketopantoate reductase family protein [Cohnella herbarum]|uniref:2-dehydropantoate 2-reductase n=1 Tax=Cohnella herbarum TaxID=2728023 RepID=A0A7Z2VIG5_9BACL|nr:2-dehydropantoate 2-reductase [Cohnella herbarum]QJD83611.1 2-dehydropantoate 2-reductase [Cohnella herbarum]
MDKIAVLGGGSLGLLLAGKMVASGCDCELWTRTGDQAALLNRNGLTIVEQTGGEVRKVNIRAIPIEQATLSENGIVLVAVKQTAFTPELLERLAEIVPDGGTLVLFQNGVGHRQLLTHGLPGRKLVMAITTEGALRINETTVRHTGIGETTIGELEIATNVIRSVERMLKQAGFTVLLSKQLEEAIMRKLLVNAVINPLTAILRLRNGELTESTGRLNAMKALFQESFGILSLYGLKNERELWNIVLKVCADTRLNESSMLQDVTAHRETEVEFINGAICRMAADKGKEAPWNNAVTALVKAIH